MKMMLVTKEQNSENMGKLSFFFFVLKWYALSNATLQPVFILKLVAKFKWIITFDRRRNIFKGKDY